MKVKIEFVASQAYEKQTVTSLKKQTVTSWKKQTVTSWNRCLLIAEIVGQDEKEQAADKESLHGQHPYKIDCEGIVNADEE